MTSRTDLHEFVLLGDQPHRGEEDPLEFERIANDLSGILMSSRASTPFTLGIEAGWGRGKSSLMRQIERRLAAEPAVKCVWFNAWTAGEGQALEGLIKTVLDRLDPNHLRRALRSRRLMGWLRFVASAAAGVLRLTSAVDAVWDQMDRDPRTRNAMQDLVAESMGRWRDKNSGVGLKTLVIFIDDLDRCSPHNVFQIFEAMKIYLDVPGFVFVVGYDTNIVSEAILREKGYVSRTQAGDYLEKIIQTSYRVPRASDEDVERLLADYLETSGTTGLFESSSVRRLLVELNARNPRKIKRFINTFVLEYRLDADWALLGPEILVRVLIVYLYFPDFGQFLERRTSRKDPVTLFLEYTRARAALRAQLEKSGGRAPVEDFLRSLGLASAEAESPEDTQIRIDREVPEFFPELVRDEEFVQLIVGLGDEVSRTRLYEKLARKPLQLETREPADGNRLTTGDLAGLTILWIDDRPEGNAVLVREMRDRGATVLETPSSTEARLMSQDRAVDLVISDISRGTDDEAGFEGLRVLRADGGYLGPALFFTGWISPSRREQAEQLDAQITNSPSDVLSIVLRLARSRDY